MMQNTAYAKLFLDSQLNHSAGYFKNADTSLDQAQRAKIAAIISRCKLQPSMRMLDVGCGWGAAARTAANEYGADVIGLTIDEEQYLYACEIEQRKSSGPPIDFRLQRWEDFTEPMDRVICINAFENFDNKSSFLPHCRSILPVGGIVVILTVTADRPIFRVVSKNEIIDSARQAGFDVEISDSLADHYAHTLEIFIRNLDRRHRDAVSIVGADRLDYDIKYYSKCAEFLRSGLNDMFEFTFIAR